MALAPLALSEWVKQLRLFGDADDWRKFNEHLMRLTEPEKKVNENANLPVFHFTFSSGGVQATITPAEAPAIDVPAAEPPQLLQVVQPAQPVGLTDDEVVARDMAELDALLGKDGA